MKASNQVMAQNPAGKKLGFSNAINSVSMRAMIDKTFSDPRRAANFVGTLISVVNANEKLKECEAESIVGAALKGEGMGLSLALGQYSVVPYGTKAQYQLSYKGLSQLAIRSGEYEDFDVFDVREGEYKGRDAKTRKPVIEWIEDENIREQTPLAGFYAFYQLKSGFFKSLYWSHEKVLEHANRYSKAFSLETYKKMLSGEMDAKEVAKLQNGSPWYGEPLSEGHMKMCRKTLLIQLLNDGKAPLSIEMQREIAADNVIEAGGVADAEATFFPATAIDAPKSAERVLEAAPEGVDTTNEAERPRTRKNAPVESDDDVPFFVNESGELPGFFDED